MQYLLVTDQVYYLVFYSNTLSPSTYHPNNLAKYANKLPLDLSL